MRTTRPLRDHYPFHDLHGHRAELLSKEQSLALVKCSFRHLFSWQLSLGRILQWGKVLAFGLGDRKGMVGLDGFRRE